MGLLDDLGGAIKGVLGQAGVAATPELISSVLAKTNLGDMQGLVSQLQQSGLGQQVQPIPAFPETPSQAHKARTSQIGSPVA